MKILTRLKAKLSSSLGIIRLHNIRTDRGLLAEFIQGLHPFETELIRAGSSSDGGYLVPKGIVINKLFSPGVSDSDSFEVSFAQTGVKCFLADFSVDNNPTPHPNIFFEKKFIGYNDERRFIGLEEWVLKYVKDDESGLLLQMDIEGWEYNNLINVSGSFLNKFDIMCIEFHEFNQVLETRSFYFIKIIFDKILRYFDVVHIHPNNGCGSSQLYGYTIPSVVEITFVRKKLNRSKKRRDIIKHELDAKNITENPDIIIEDWFR
jgi:hypothetical protein